MLEKLGIRPGKTFIVWTNNTTTESVIKKRKLGDRAVNDEWKIIQMLLVRLQTNITARRVVLAENKADTLSRGERGNLEMWKRVAIKMPFDLNHTIKKM